MSAGNMNQEDKYEVVAADSKAQDAQDSKAEQESKSSEPEPKSGSSPEKEPKPSSPSKHINMADYEASKPTLTVEELQYFTEFQIRANGDACGEVKSGSSEAKKQERYVASFFHRLQQTDISKWRYIFDYYLVYTVHKSIRLRQALLRSEWQSYLFPLLSRAYPQPLPENANEKQVRETEEAKDAYFRLAASILAVTGQLIKHSFVENQGGLGYILTSSIAALYKNCPDYIEAESLSRRLLMVTIKEIEASAQSFKLNYTHPGWSNLFDFMSVLHNFIFFSPTPKKPHQPHHPPSPSKKSRRDEREVKMHIGGAGSADAPIVESLVNLLNHTLKVHKIDRVKEADKDAALAQKKLKAKLDVEKEFWAQLHVFFQTLPLFKGAANAKNMVATILELETKRESTVPKAQLEIALNALVHVVSINATGVKRIEVERNRASSEDGLINRSPERSLHR